MKTREFGPELFKNPLGIINDWYSLSTQKHSDSPGI